MKGTRKDPVCTPCEPLVPGEDAAVPGNEGCQKTTILVLYVEQGGLGGSWGHLLPTRQCQYYHPHGMEIPERGAPGETPPKVLDSQGLSRDLNLRLKGCNTASILRFTSLLFSR